VHSAHWTDGEACRYDPLLVALPVRRAVNVVPGAKQGQDPKQSERPRRNPRRGQVYALAQSGLSGDAQIALKKMIDEYDRGMDDERRFHDRPTAADRTGSTARPRLRYVLAAAEGESPQRPSG
jgi:hypothetical protein